MWFLLTSPAIAYASIAICFRVVSFASLNQRQRNVVFERLRIRRRRPSSARTPPRSLSPENKIPINTLQPANDYVNVFPPSQRYVLRAILDRMSHEQRAALGDLDFDEENFEKSILGWEEEYSSADDSKYLYSGFSVREIKALGQFPDYATLSGVSLPQPYHDFDIKKALPRPYRPLRWNYHQTMSLSKMDTDFWLELERTYVDRIRERKALYDEHGSGVLKWLPGSELACRELMEMCLQFLCARYPHLFTMYPAPDYPEKVVLENKILNTKLVVQDMHPLLVLLETVPEDFAIVMAPLWRKNTHTDVATDASTSRNGVVSFSSRVCAIVSF